MEKTTNDQATQRTHRHGARGRQKAQRKRWLGAVIGGFAVLGVGYGAYWALLLRHHEVDRRRLRQGNVVQITPQIAGHGGRDRTPTTPIREGRPAAGAARPGRRAGRARAGRGAARADGARGAHPVRHQRRSCRRRWRCARPTSRAPTKTSRAASGWPSSGAVSGGRSCSTRATRCAARRRRSLAAQQQLAANRARVDHTTVENHPDVQRAAAHVRDAYLAYARTSCRRRSPATSPSAACSSASASARARR